MYEERFSKWMKWNERNKAERLHYPGVYVCVISENDISNQVFKWLPEIMYIGMTNSKLGLKSRLKQFDNTILGKSGHGGADRVRYKYQNYNELIDKLFVSVARFVCDVPNQQPSDLRVMGEVAKFEYDCFAYFVQLYGELPEFNNQKQSPKYSSAYGRKKTS